MGKNTFGGVTLILLLFCNEGFAQIAARIETELEGLSRPIRSISVNLGGPARTFTNAANDAEWPDSQVLADIAQVVDAAPQANAVITITAAGGAERVIRRPAAGTGGNVDASTATTEGASCEAAADKWIDEVEELDVAVLKSKRVVVVFDTRGRICRRSAERVTEGDILHVGVFGDRAVVEKMALDVPTCSLESTAIDILDTITGIRVESGTELALQKFDPVECYDASIQLQVRREDRSIAWDHTLKQYQRFRGTAQVGIVWTELDDITYSTADLGSGPVIRSDRDDSSGPQYVGSLVVYGFANYLRSLGGERHYAGRDIVNETRPLDRLGLVFSLGFDDPKDTLGIGLSFELATGINLTATQLYRRIDKLDGYSLGDPFTGATVPTVKSWEDELVFGVSIDGRYLASFFGTAN